MLESNLKLEFVKVTRSSVAFLISGRVRQTILGEKNALIESTGMTND